MSFFDINKLLVLFFLYKLLNLCKIAVWIINCYNNPKTSKEKYAIRLILIESCILYILQ